jgi:hypothetical protein
MNLEPGQIWRDAKGNHVEIKEIIGSLTVEVRLPDGDFWVLKDRLIGPMATYEFVGSSRLLAAA